MSNIAKDLIWPRGNNILVRVVFLYVGQGDSTIVIAADNGAYQTLLIDINLDKKNGGIDVPRLMSDLLEDESNRLGAFINSHPHNDHLCGVVELSEAVEIAEVWHSGHIPGRKHKDAYDNLQEVIRKVKDAGGTETKLRGSRSPKKFGEADCYVLAPAEYVCDEIDDETEEERYRRIHEQCAVLKFGNGSTWIMQVGDADRDAWEKHITEYHSERLEAAILGSAHHGSRTFFRYAEADPPYLDALKKIGPEYVIISAPKRDESQWGHPHEDAVQFYTDEVGQDNILHTGESRHSFICDIFHDGKYAVQTDDGDLAEAYSFDEEEEDGGSGSRQAVNVPTIINSRIDQRPMGNL